MTLAGGFLGRLDGMLAAVLTSGSHSHGPAARVTALSGPASQTEALHALSRESAPLSPPPLSLSQLISLSLSPFRPSFSLSPFALWSAVSIVSGYAAV